MSKVREWLEAIGLVQYADAFEANDIDVDLLGQVDDQMLKDIGVSSAGHRLRIRNAIAKLNPIVRLAKDENAAGAASETPAASAERRQVTVMFSDLVGSTALSARMDPEDLREVISAYQKCVSETVRRFDGFVAKYMGDGVLVYFGYPQAHEDDAERAVRAGLELIQAVGGLKSSAPLQTRVGIATGLVVVGDLIGSGEAQERGIVGETPNLAARLQGIAQPNTVVIAESTRKLLGNLFELEDLGSKDLKGIADPVRAWAALRPSSVESRFDALHASGLTALVGREEELELLLRRWSRAKIGEGQAVLLSGEAGIGKSRLTAALLERLTGEPHTRLRYFCSPQRTDSALFPVISQMERAAGFVHDDPPQAKLDKLDAVLAQTSTSTEDAALFAEMLSLPNDGRYPKLDLPPERRRQRTLAALVSQMEALARQNAVLMIFEDAHWTDPTSLELFGRAVDRIASLRVLLIVTFRPEFAPPWIGRPHVTALTINRLAQRDIDAMIDGVVGNKLLAASIRQDIIERTDGIPLFVEEMTKAMLEADSQGAAEYTAAAVPSPTLAVPASLQASLMARLDRLGSAKEVAQIGAAVGREFSHALLAAVVHSPKAELASALDRLIGAGLLFQQGVPPHASYLFKHALVQDAAYGTLLREPRRALHARIADALEAQFAEIVQNQPEMLAHHYTEAGMFDRAVQYWQQAGLRAAQHSANVEASKHLTKALGVLRQHFAPEERSHQELSLLIALGPTQMATGGWNASEVRKTYDTALRIAHELGRAAEVFPVVWGRWLTAHAGGEADSARQLLWQLFDLAPEGNAALLLQAHHAATSVMCTGGEFVKAIHHAEAGTALYDLEAHRHQAMSYGGHDPNVCIQCMAALVRMILGQASQARRLSDEAVALANKVEHAPSIAHAQWYRAELSQILGHVSPALELSENVLKVAIDKGLSQYAAWAKMMRGWVLTVNGSVESGVEEMEEGFSELRITGSRYHLPHRLAMRAQTFAAAERYAKAIEVVEEALASVEQTGERWYEPEVLRIKASILATFVPLESKAAVRCLEQAIAVAAKQGARLWEARARIDLATLLSKRDRNAARCVLQPMISWEEKVDLPERSEAHVMHEQLGR